MDQGTFSFIFIAGMIAIVYFLMIRPQNQQRKRHEDMVASLAKGDKIILHSGIHGTIKGVDDATIDVEIASGVVIVQQKALVMSIDQKAPEKRAATKRAAPKKEAASKEPAKKAPAKRAATKTPSRARTTKESD